MARSRILLKFVIFDHRGPVQAKNFIFSNKCGPIQDFAQNCIFDHRGHVEDEMSIFPKILAQSRILLKILIFDHRGHVHFHFAFHFFPIILARSKILLKIVIFEHHGHVEDENFNFSINSGPIKNFAQNCHF